ncbi:MAG: hypothetical protein KJ566_01860 [Nanoarchaeota archaeon]|nr:hypothetical protein [Nanoarchaeota archaeon]
MKRSDKYFLLSWRKAWIIVVCWFLAVILHNLFYALFKSYFDATGGDEPVFFIIAIILIPIYVLICIVYSLIELIKRRLKMVKKKIKKEKAGKLDAGKLGLASGILFAACVFLMTLSATWIGYGQHCALSIQDIYGFLGYSISFVGAILGAVYAFIDGFIFAWLLASIYNKLL